MDHEFEKAPQDRREALRKIVSYSVLAILVLTTIVTVESNRNYRNDHAPTLLKQQAMSFQAKTS